MVYEKQKLKSYSLPKLIFLKILNTCIDLFFINLSFNTLFFLFSKIDMAEIFGPLNGEYTFKILQTLFLNLIWVPFIVLFVFIWGLLILYSITAPLEKTIWYLFYSQCFL